MATYPNNYRTGVGFLPNYTFFGIIPYYIYNAELGTGAGSRLNWLIGSDGGGFPKTSSAPDGYDMKTPFPPVKAGGISAWNDPVAQLSMTGALLQGGPMEGTGSMEFTVPDGSLSMVISMSGNVAIATLTGESMVLRLTVGLSGNGAFQLTGTNNLALIVPFEGAGTVLTMGAGATDLRGLLSMEGEWSPFTELSPEGLANAVWSSLAAQYNDAGTMGNKLNSASAAGDPWGADLSSYPAGTAGSHLAILAKINRNKTISDPATGILTVYDDDGVTPLLTAQLYKDAAGSETYSGTGVERRERLA